MVPSSSLRGEFRATANTEEQIYYGPRLPVGRIRAVDPNSLMLNFDSPPAEPPLAANMPTDDHTNQFASVAKAVSFATRLAPTSHRRRRCYFLEPSRSNGSGKCPFRIANSVAQAFVLPFDPAPSSSSSTGTATSGSLTARYVAAADRTAPSE